MAVDKTRKEERRKAPSNLTTRPKLWALVLGSCGVIVIVFGLVHIQAQLGNWSVVVAGGFGLVVIASAAVGAVVAAAVVTWITVIVLLAIIGRSRRRLVVEGTKISKEIMKGSLVKVLLKEANVLAGLCAAFLGCLALAWAPLFMASPNYFG